MRKKADTVASAAYAGCHGVLSDLTASAPAPLQTYHLYTGAPHSEQNLAPAGSGLPQFGQNDALVSIFSPQERQNLEPAGTEAPHFGHTAWPPAAGAVGWNPPCPGSGYP